MDVSLMIGEASRRLALQPVADHKDGFKIGDDGGLELELDVMVETER